MGQANRFPKEVHVPAHNARFVKAPEDDASAFVPLAGSVRDVLCIHADRIVGNDNTVRCKRLTLQVPPDRHCHHGVKVRVRVHACPDGTLAVFHGPRCLAHDQGNGEPIETSTRKAA